MAAGAKAAVNAGRKMASAFEKGLSPGGKDAAKAARHIKKGGKGARDAAKKAKAPVEEAAERPWQLIRPEAEDYLYATHKTMADEFFGLVESDMSPLQAARRSRMYYEEFGPAGDGRKVTHVFFSASKGRGERLYLLEDSKQRVCKVLQAGGHWSDGETNAIMRSARNMVTTRI